MRNKGNIKPQISFQYAGIETIMQLKNAAKAFIGNHHQEPVVVKDSLRGRCAPHSEGNLRDSPNFRTDMGNESILWYIVNGKHQ